MALATAVALAQPAAAAGTAPTPADDSYSIVDKDAFDVLANDSDPDVQLLTVSAFSQPSHGGVTCLANGACTYTASSGYVGPDSFTYTARDPQLNTATATVTIDVTGAPATTNPPTPVPDELVTKANQQVTTNVLSNDQHGANASVSLPSTTTNHGTVSCTSAGSCTYTPTTDFVGYDGFNYDVTDDLGTSHGTALVTVVSASAGYTQVAAGRPANAASGTSIVQGDNAAWSVGAKVTPVNLPQQWAAANLPPATTVTLTGAHTLADASTTTTAPGWNAANGASSRTFTPTSSALLGEATTNPLPPPLPPISQGTGGDGHVPIPVGTKVFAFYHHSVPTSVTCIDRTTGALCPGYPHQLNVNSSDTIGPGAVVGSKIYVHVSTAAFYAQAAPVALYCWDTSTDSTCGLVIVDRLLNQTSVLGGSAPRLISGKMYLVSDGGLAYCADPSTGAACGGSWPVADGFDGTQFGYSYDAVAHGTRLFVSSSAQDNTGYPTTCIDTATAALCSGWSPPKSLHSPDLVNHYSTSGVADGVCSVDPDHGECILDATPATTSTTGGWPVSELYYSISAEAETGTKTLFAIGLSGNGMGCWNWVTNALCTGGHYVDGVIDTDNSANSLPSAYGAAYDGACAIGLGDPGQVFTVDPAGFTPCTTLSAGSIRRIVDLRNQRCDGGVGAATWTDLKVVESNLTAGQDFNSLTVTVSDATTNEVLATQEMVGSNGTIDLSSISAATHPSLAIDASADTAGNAAWADGDPPRLILEWHADPAQGCFQTTTVPDCSVTTAQSIGITSTPTTGTPATASLTLNPRNDCKTLSVTKNGTGAGTVTSNPTGINCGATCSFAWISGTSVTLTAAATAGSVFAGWSGGGCSGTGTCVVNLTATTSVTATFTAQSTITVSKNGSGSGTVTSNPAGINCGATCSAQYGNGTSVVLTAAASAGSVFTGWSGAGCSGTGTCTITVSADATVTATFALLRTLTVTKSGSGSGSVSSSPAGISCGATCTAQYADGTSVTLTANPTGNSTFGGWSGGGCSGTGTCIVAMSADTTVTATFNVPNQPTLTVSKSGAGSGTVTSSPAGINCGATCSAQFSSGTSVTLTATPAAGSTFTGWSGGGCSGTGTCTFSLTTDTTVTATFALIQRTLTVSKNGTGSGTVTSNPAGINCGATCSAQYDNGTSVTLTATGAAGSTFTGWSGGGCSGTSTCSVSMNADATVTATFTLSAQPTLTVSKSGAGGGTVTSSPAGIDCGATCTAAFASGTSVTLTASAAAGSAFTGWSGGGCSGTSTCTVSLSSDTTVTASFAVVRTLVVAKAGSGSGSVTSSPAGISCGATCSADFVDGTSVTLTPSPASGSAFLGWSGGGCSASSAICVVSLTSNTNVTATFTLLRSLTVNKTGTGSGTVTSDPPGMNCGATCHVYYVDGLTVTLTATPAAGSTFTGWSGGGCSGTSTCVLVMNGDATVTATFTSTSLITLTVLKAGGGTGTVTSSPAGIDCGATCVATYASGTVVTLSASWANDTLFEGWAGASCGRASLCTVALTAPTTITATFRAFTPQLLAGVTGTGSGVVTSAPSGIQCGDVCANTFPYGTAVTLTPGPVPGAAFAGWSGGCTGTGSCTITLTDDAAVTATFNDVTAPQLTMTGPAAYFLSGRSAAATWTVSDTGGSGLDHVEVAWTRRTVGGGTFSAWKSQPGWTALTGTSVVLGNLASGYEYCFRARGLDKAGNVGAWRSRCTRVPVDGSDLTASKGWGSKSGQAGYFDGTYSNSTTRGATLATAAAVKAKRIGLLVTTCPTCGSVAVLVGGTKVATVSLVTSAPSLHRWVILPAFATTKTGVITLRVASTGKTVRIDALGYTVV
jgi:hypothetical protein